MKKEIWKDVPSAPGYTVSNLGRVIGKRGNVLSPGKAGNGYMFFKAWYGSKSLHRLVHRAVCEAFLGPSKLYVDHINFVRDDNRLENLRYLTQQENVMHSVDNGRHTRGEKSVLSLLTDDAVRDIKANFKKGQSLRFMKKYNVSKWTILDVYHGRTWKHVG